MFKYHTLKSSTEVAFFKNDCPVYPYLQIYLLESIFLKISGMYKTCIYEKFIFYLLYRGIYPLASCKF